MAIIYFAAEMRALASFCGLKCGAVGGVRLVGSGEILNIARYDLIYPPKVEVVYMSTAPIQTNSFARTK